MPTRGLLLLLLFLLLLLLLLLLLAACNVCVCEAAQPKATQSDVVCATSTAMRVWVGCSHSDGCAARVSVSVPSTGYRLGLHCRKETPSTTNATYCSLRLQRRCVDRVAFAHVRHRPCAVCRDCTPYRSFGCFCAPLRRDADCCPCHNRPTVSWAR